MVAFFSPQWLFPRRKGHKQAVYGEKASMSVHHESSISEPIWDGRLLQCSVPELLLSTVFTKKLKISDWVHVKLMHGAPGKLSVHPRDCILHCRIYIYASIIFHQSVWDIPKIMSENPFICHFIPCYISALTTAKKTSNHGKIFWCKARSFHHFRIFYVILMKPSVMHSVRVSTFPATFKLCRSWSTSVKEQTIFYFTVFGVQYEYCSLIFPVNWAKNLQRKNTGQT